MFKISIPKPCYENWEAMLPNEKGRHCNTCVKTVVDFTAMSDDEVKHFLLNKKVEKVCGRFRTEQLHRITIELPGNIFYLPLPFWKKFLAACLLVFSTTLFSCETRVKDEPVPATSFSTKITASEFNIGKPSVPPPPPPVCTTVGDLRVIMVADSTTTGVIMIEPLVNAQPPQEVETLVIDTATKISNIDSLLTKNPPVADSNNCSGVIFY